MTVAQYGAQLVCVGFGFLMGSANMVGEREGRIAGAAAMIIGIGLQFWGGR